MTILTLRMPISAFYLQGLCAEMLQKCKHVPSMISKTAFYLPVGNYSDTMIDTYVHMHIYYIIYIISYYVYIYMHTWTYTYSNTWQHLRRVLRKFLISSVLPAAPKDRDSLTSVILITISIWQWAMEVQFQNVQRKHQTGWWQEEARR